MLHRIPLSNLLFSCLCLAIALSCTLSARAQQDSSDMPLYLKYNTIPQFSLVKQDGSPFTKSDLKKNKPVLFFLFSVDCDHCHHETEELLKNIDQFKGTQVVMVTYFALNDMLGYYKNYNIQRYPLITMTTDPKRWLFTFFHLRFFPGLYIYNKKQELVYHFEGTAKMDTLLHYLKEK